MKNQYIGGLPKKRLRQCTDLRGGYGWLIPQYKL